MLSFKGTDKLLVYTWANEYSSDRLYDDYNADYADAKLADKPETAESPPPRRIDSAGINTAGSTKQSPRSLTRVRTSSKEYRPKNPQERTESAPKPSKRLKLGVATPQPLRIPKSSISDDSEAPLKPSRKRKIKKHQPPTKEKQRSVSREIDAPQSNDRAVYQKSALTQGRGGNSLNKYVDESESESDSSRIHPVTEPPQEPRVQVDHQQDPLGSSTLSLRDQTINSYLKAHVESEAAATSSQRPNAPPFLTEMATPALSHVESPLDGVRKIGRADDDPLRIVDVTSALMGKFKAVQEKYGEDEMRDRLGLNVSKFRQKTADQIKSTQAYLDSLEGLDKWLDMMG